jgi:hypothetical protein
LAFDEGFLRFASTSLTCCEMVVSWEVSWLKVFSISRRLLFFREISDSNSNYCEPSCCWLWRSWDLLDSAYWRSLKA